MKKIYFKYIIFFMLFVLLILILAFDSYVRYKAINSTPVEDIRKAKVDSLTKDNNQIKTELRNLDSVRHENIRKSINLNDSDTVELFYWLLSK